MVAIHDRFRGLQSLLALLLIAFAANVVDIGDALADNIAPSCTAYGWKNLGSATGNANRLATPGLNDGAMVDIDLSRGTGGKT